MGRQILPTTRQFASCKLSFCCPVFQYVSTLVAPSKLFIGFLLSVSMKLMMRALILARGLATKKFIRYESKREN